MHKLTKIKLLTGKDSQKLSKVELTWNLSSEWVNMMKYADNDLSMSESS